MTRIAFEAHALRRLPLFSALTDTQFAWIAPALKQRTYAPRAVILHSGEPPDGLYLVLSGRARIVHEDGNGHALIAGDVAPGEFFGEMGLIDASACPASIRAVDECAVAYIPRKTFLELIEDNGAAAIQVLKVVVERLCRAHHKMADLALTTVQSRVERVLLEFGREADGEWLVEPGAEQIAAMVGASREMVSRVVKNMVAAGIARRWKRKLIICDRAALARGRTGPQRGGEAAAT